MILRKAKIVVSFLLCFAQYVFAQNPDSLKKVLSSAKSDEIKATLLLQTGKIYAAVNSDSSKLYLHKALVLGQKEAAYSTCCNASRDIGDYYYRSSQFDSALIYDKLALRYARLLNDQRYLCMTMLAIAGTYSTNDDAAACVAYADTALRLSLQLNDSEYMARAYSMQGVGYTALEDYTNALDAVRHSIAIYEHRKAYAYLGEAYMLSANILDLQKDFSESLKYHELAKEKLVAAHDTFVMSQNEVNTAIVYSEMGNYKKAIDIFKMILPGLKERGPGWATTCLGLAVALGKNGNYAEAENTFRQIEKAITEGSLHDLFLEGQFYAEFADLYLREGRYDKALVYAKRNEQLLAQGQPAVTDVMQGMKLLSDIYHAKGDVATAYDYYIKYSSLKDTIAASEQTKSYAQAEAKFNLAERDKTIKMLSTQNELQKALGKKDRVISIALFLILVLVLLFVTIGINSYRKTLRQKKIIDEQVVQLAHAASMKSRFFANISHELRTPVTLLTGMLELMSKQHRDDAKEKERLSVAYNNSQKLQHMVEEILDLTKLENNVSAPVFEIKEIAPLLKRIVYTFETLIEKGQISLEFDATAAGGLYISTDPHKFEKVINNLIYNAIKFNRTGGFIKVSAYPSADKKQINIDVSDSGIGIASGDLPHIFEHFYQSDASGAKAEGAGIGLSLVKEFTTQMSGEIAVHSKYGEGTTFTLQFPTAEVIEQEAQQEESAVAVEAWEKFNDRQTVLIVEDNAEMRYYLKEVLGDKVNIASAENGIEALAWLGNEMPDLIISDVMMPGMDGREFVNRIKADERYNRIPVITLTALADIENQLSFLRMGIDDYMVKPFNADELRIRVYNLLANNAERKAFNKEPAEPDDIIPDNKEADEFREKITKYVSARLKNDQISVYELALELGLSERQFYRLAKSLTGCTPAQLIKEVRLQKAYELLIAGKVFKIEDLAKRVGYENISYFSRQFLERFGKRPAEFL